MQEQLAQLTPVQGRAPSATQISRVHVLRTKQMDLDISCRQQVREYRDSASLIRIDPNFAGVPSPLTVPPGTSISPVPTPSLRIMMAHNKAKVTALTIALISALITFLLQRLGMPSP